MQNTTGKIRKSNMKRIIFLFILSGWFAGQVTASGEPQLPGRTAEVQLDEIVVTGTRTRHTLDDVPVETQVITRMEIDRLPSQNIVDVLKGVTGINISTLDDVMGSDNLRSTMRGLQFNEGYGLILIDGQRVHGEMGAHGDYGVSLNQIPLSMIERIEIVKGASSALYGSDALAGVINIITRRAPEENTVFGGGSYGRYEVTNRRNVSPNKSTREYYRANAGFGGRFMDKSGYFFQYGYEQDEGTAFDAAKAYRHSLMGKWHTEVTDDFSFNLSTNYGHGRRELGVPVAKYDREYDSYRLSGGLNYRFNEHEFAFSGSTYRQDFINGYPGFDHGFREGIIGHDQAEAVYHWYSDRNIFTAGAARQRQSMDYFSINYLGGVERSTITVDRNVTTNSLFLQNELMILEKRLTLVPGVRLENHSTFGTEINPKFSAMFKASSSTTLRGSVGRAFKSPTIRQLYYDGLMRHGDYYIRSNPDLNPETAMNYSINLEQGLFNDRLIFNAGLFYFDLKNMVIRQATGETASDGIPIESYYNVQKSRIQGGEFSGRLILNSFFFLNGGLTYTDTENSSTGLNLPYAPRYTWTLSPAYIYEPRNTGANIVLTRVCKQYRNESNTQDLGSHTLIDIRIWKQFSNLGRISADLKNITNSDRGEGDYAHRMGRSIGLNVEFEF